MRNPLLLHAIELAVENVRLRRGGPFGAVVARNGEILGEGVNLVTKSCDPTAHAEIMAIRMACQTLNTYELKGCQIYTSCEPCPMCLAAIYWARLEHIHFAAGQDDAAAAGFDDAFLYRELTLPVAQRQIPTVQDCREEALTAFAAWREDHAKIPY